MARRKNVSAMFNCLLKAYYLIAYKTNMPQTFCRSIVSSRITDKLLFTYT